MTRYTCLGKECVDSGQPLKAPTGANAATLQAFEGFQSPLRPWQPTLCTPQSCVWKIKLLSQLANEKSFTLISNLEHLLEPSLLILAKLVYLFNSLAWHPRLRTPCPKAELLLWWFSAQFEGGTGTAMLYRFKLQTGVSEHLDTPSTLLSIWSPF